MTKTAATTSAQARDAITRALRLDLIGPESGDEARAREVLPTSPSSYYLTGFLVPYEAEVQERIDLEPQAEIDETPAHPAGDDDVAVDAPSGRRTWFPSSMGLTVLVPAEAKQVSVRIAWGDYDRPEDDDGHGGEVPWTRTPDARDERIDLAKKQGELPLPGTGRAGHGSLRLVWRVHPVPPRPGVPKGARSLSVFLVNHRTPEGDAFRDRAYCFQPELTLTTEAQFLARPDLLAAGDDDESGRLRDEWDERVSALQYRDLGEHAVGHNVSVSATVVDRVCRAVRTEWMPSAEVEKVTAAKFPGVELGMEVLAAAPDHAALRLLLEPLLSGYAAWVGEQRDALVSIADAKQEKTAKDLLERAARAHARMERGLRSLEDADALDAFRLANRCVARALRQRGAQETGLGPDALEPPAWRPFQLAFLLLNLSGVVDPEGPLGKDDRRTVDLLFFPTGGGKTEAYLGLAAFTLMLRRLRQPGLAGAGVGVLMRYTLRLLTLDQLDRAATLICAMELKRQQDEARLGSWPFEIGLWVGQSATPNRMGEKGSSDKHSARAKTIAFQNDPKNPRNPAPIPIQKCPWCGAVFAKESFRLLPNTDAPTDLRVFCANRACAFWFRGEQKRGLPVLGVDEPIYRRLPAFIIATVDKFAALPWTGDTANLFGKVTRYDDEGFYGPGSAASGSPTNGKKLETNLAPPELVIQDELHLISGPLGSMVGLYETAIEELSKNEHGTPPKIVASTATVRRAERQIRALFGRTAVEVFPPPGPDRRDSYFAKTVSASERNPRLYVGIGAQGRNLKVVLLRTYLALMSAAERQWALAGGASNEANPADPYMTLIGYFNSLRELGGSRRIVEDEVDAQLADYAERRARVGEDPKATLLANRKGLHSPPELTSRVTTGEVAATKDALKLRFHEKGRVDVALATNMISVGLDITRLGLMVVLGQPKTVAEYIQSTSRVGRDDDRPGLVVTLLNVHKPRDRSHYERFEAFHQSFYRAVEPTSVTPWSSGALDRGLAGITVALARHMNQEMTPPRGAGEIEAQRTALDVVAKTLADRAAMHDGDHGDADAEALRGEVRDRVTSLLDAWANIAHERGGLQYQDEVRAVANLLYPPLDPRLDRIPKSERAFTANRSLRDVEPTVDFWLVEPGADEGEVLS